MAQPNTIFVQIAAYRDPLLVSTIQHLLSNAKNPENITICIAWQHSPDEKIDEIKDLPNVKILDIPHDKTGGCCWARNLIQQQYTNEKYSLCLDSHHRFTPNWDETCINMLEELRAKGHEKPLLTSYIPSFNPETYPAGRTEVPWLMNFDRFIPEGAVFFLPATIPNWQSYNSPLPARFLSAHFIFTLGQWNKEVIYDPHYYFHGEEINLAVRSFTHGYDLFCPHKVICWHEYTRKGRTKHWDDAPKWGEQNKESHLRNRKLFGMDNEVQDIDFGIYGFGTKRTLRDYELYAGISFKNRSVQQYTLENKIAPNPPVENWEASLTRRFKHCIDAHRPQFTETDYDFWCVAFKAADGRDLYRKDANLEEVKACLAGDDQWVKIWREFDVVEKPASWIVWPHSMSKGWCNQIIGKL